MNVEIPDWLIEISEQMNESDKRATAFPYWQVRCKRIVTAASGIGDDFAIVGEDGEIYNSISDDREGLIEFLRDYFDEWVEEYEEDFGDIDDFDPINTNLLPDDLECYSIQEIEEVVSTHLTQHDAEWFIKRKQHDFPKLYTYVASAYWSPQFKQLQDWIRSLTGGESGR